MSKKSTTDTRAWSIKLIKDNQGQNVRSKILHIQTMSRAMHFGLPSIHLE